MSGERAQARGATLYLPPAWFASDQPPRLRVLDGSTGTTLELEGELRDALLDGRVPPSLSVMAQHEEALGRLVEALGAGRFEPLTRARLLRGHGYSLLFVELTARCNERCVHCYADSSPERDERLEAVTLEGVLVDAAALGFPMVQFTGGDPLVSELCLPGVQMARQLGIRYVEIYTNGLALSASLFERLARHAPGFAFSFYSHDAEVHDAITRTRDSQRRTLAAIERVVSAALPLRVNVIVMDENRDHLAATIDLLVGRGVARDAIGVDVQRSVGRGLMTIRPKDAALPQAPGAHKAAASPTFGGRVAVAYDGSVFPCIFSRGLCLGSVHDRSLSEILEAPIELEADVALLHASCERSHEQLSCWDCRVRGAVLGQQLSPSPTSRYGAAR